MSKASDLFRKNLKSALERNGISQGKLSALTGIAQPAISKFLSDSEHEPRLDTAERISEALGCHLWEMLDPKVKPAPKDGFTSTQREIITLIRRMTDDELEPFLAFLRSWPGNEPIEAGDDKKHA